MEIASCLILQEVPILPMIIVLLDIGVGDYADYNKNYPFEDARFFPIQANLINAGGATNIV